METPIKNYFLMNQTQLEEVKIWAQMFFDDGSVTQGKYVPVYTYQDEEAIKQLAMHFLQETCRTEGVLFLWGAGKVYAKKAELLTLRRGVLKGSQTLRLRNL